MSENNDQASKLSQEELQRRLDENRAQKPKSKIGSKRVFMKPANTQPTTNYTTVFVKSNRNLCKNNDGSISVHQELLLYAPGSENEKAEKELKLIHEKTEPLGPAKFTSDMTGRAFRGEKSLRILLDTVFHPPPSGSAFEVHDQLFLVDGENEEFIANFEQIHLPKGKKELPAQFDLSGNIGISIKQQLATRDPRGYRIKDAIEIRTHNSSIMPTQQLPCIPSAQPVTGTSAKFTEKVFAGKDVIRVDRDVVFDVDETMQRMADHQEYVPVGAVAKTESRSSTRTGRSISSDLPPTARSEFTTNTAISPYQPDESSSESERGNANTARHRSPSSTRSPSGVRMSRPSSKKWTVNSRRKKRADNLRTAASPGSPSAPVTQHSPTTLAALLQEREKFNLNERGYSLHLSESDISNMSTDRSEELSLANGWYGHNTSRVGSQISRVPSESKSSSIRGAATAPFSKLNTERERDLANVPMSNSKEAEEKSAKTAILKGIPVDTVEKSASAKLTRTPINSTAQTARSRPSISPSLRRTLIKETLEISSFPPPHHFVFPGDDSNRPKNRNRSTSSSFEPIEPAREADSSTNCKLLSAEKITDDKVPPMENTWSVSKKSIKESRQRADSTEKDPTAAQFDSPTSNVETARSIPGRSTSPGSPLSLEKYDYEAMFPKCTRRWVNPAEFTPKPIGYVTPDVGKYFAAVQGSPTPGVETARSISGPGDPRNTPTRYDQADASVQDSPTSGVETAHSIRGRSESPKERRMDGAPSHMPLRWAKSSGYDSPAPGMHSAFPHAPRPLTPGQRHVFRQQPLNLGEEYHRKNSQAVVMPNNIEQQQPVYGMDAPTGQPAEQDPDNIKVEFQLKIHSAAPAQAHLHGTIDPSLKPKRILLNGRQIWQSPPH